MEIHLTNKRLVCLCASLQCTSACISCFTDVTSHLDAVKKKLGFICVRWSISDEMDHIVCVKQPNYNGRKVRDWYRLELLSSTMDSAHLKRSSATEYPLSTYIPFSHHRFYLNQFYDDSTIES